MSKDLLDAVIGTAPPSTVDVWDIMRRRRRVIALRRAGIAATSVVAASALVVAGLSFASGGRGDAGPAAPAQIFVVPFGTLSPDLTPQDLADAVVQAVASVAPDAQWASQPLVVASPTDGPSAGALFRGDASLARAGRTGPFAVSIGANADAFVCTEAVQETCEVGLSPAGGTLVTRRHWTPAESCTIASGPNLPSGTATLCGDAPGNPPEWTISWGLDLALADGVVLEVNAYASKHAQYAALGPVLTEAELVAVVDDIASRITT